MKRILVTGANGQLGRALAQRIADRDVVDTLADTKFTFIGRDTLDLASTDSFESVITGIDPDIVINTAAYTDVDRAETEPDRAMAVNAAGPGRLAELCARRRTRFVHISTDYVFSGDKPTPYIESDPIDPRSAYGQSKAAGEMRVREADPTAVIIRTAWVYSPFGKNFVRTMLRLAADRDHLRVVADQSGNPTSAFDLADGLITMCRYWQASPEMGAGRIYHLAGRGDATWADLARAVFVHSAEFGGPVATVEDIGTADFPTKAQRPVSSRMDCGLFREMFGYQSPPWRDALRAVVKRLVAEDHKA